MITGRRRGKAKRWEGYQLQTELKNGLGAENRRPDENNKKQ